MLTAADNRGFAGDGPEKVGEAEVSAEIPAEIPIWDFGTCLVARAGPFARFGTKPRPILKMASMYTHQSTKEII
jgi:hypothetical protein